MYLEETVDGYSCWIRALKCKSVAQEVIRAFDRKRDGEWEPRKTITYAKPKH